MFNFGKPQWKQFQKQVLLLSAYRLVTLYFLAELPVNSLNRWICLADNWTFNIDFQKKNDQVMSCVLIFFFFKNRRSLHLQNLLPFTWSIFITVLINSGKHHIVNCLTVIVKNERYRSFENVVIQWWFKLSQISVDTASWNKESCKMFSGFIDICTSIL